MAREVGFLGTRPSMFVGAILVSTLFQDYGLTPLGVKPENDPDTADKQRIRRHIHFGQPRIMKRARVDRPDHPTRRNETSHSSFPKDVHW